MSQPQETSVRPVPPMIQRTTAIREAFIAAGYRPRSRAGVYQMPAWTVIRGKRK